MVTKRMTIYGHKKKVYLEQNISIVSFHALFLNFHNISIFMWNYHKS